MTRTSLWIAVGCVALLGCKPGKVRLEGDLTLDGARLGFVEVELIPEEPMKAFLARGLELSKGRPAAAFSVKTDHEGTFFLNVPAGTYAVFTRASRGSGAEKREAEWLLWRTVEAGGAPLSLSDDNQVGSGCAECIQVVREALVPPQSAAPELNPVVTMAQTSQVMVMGSLDKELVRRVVHANRGQVRYCYESLLYKFPSLSGAVTVKFVIAATGKVAAAAIAQSTVGNAQLEACLAGRVRTWTFPKPRGGGVVVVNYPFKFAQEG